MLSTIKKTQLPRYNRKDGYFLQSQSQTNSTQTNRTLDLKAFIQAQQSQFEIVEWWMLMLTNKIKDKTGSNWMSVKWSELMLRYKSVWYLQYIANVGCCGWTVFCTKTGNGGKLQAGLSTGDTICLYNNVIDIWKMLISDKKWLLFRSEDQFVFTLY